MAAASSSARARHLLAPAASWLRPAMSPAAPRPCTSRPSSRDAHCCCGPSSTPAVTRLAAARTAPTAPIGLRPQCPAAHLTVGVPLAPLVVSGAASTPSLASPSSPLLVDPGATSTPPRTAVAERRSPEPSTVAAVILISPRAASPSLTAPRPYNAGEATGLLSPLSLSPAPSTRALMAAASSSARARPRRPARARHLLAPAASWLRPAMSPCCAPTLHAASVLPRRSLLLRPELHASRHPPCRSTHRADRACASPTPCASPHATARGSTGVRHHAALTSPRGYLRSPPPRAPFCTSPTARRSPFRPRPPASPVPAPCRVRPPLGVCARSGRAAPRAR
nr:proline-rich protein 36-like [Aegilops tauschii subsp. strangulata]